MAAVDTAWVGYDAQSGGPAESPPGPPDEESGGTRCAGSSGETIPRVHAAQSAATSPGRQDTLEQHEDGDGGDPDEVHDSADEQQQHQRPQQPRQ